MGSLEVQAVSKMEMLPCLSLVNLSFIGKTDSWGYNSDSLKEVLNRMQTI